MRTFATLILASLFFASPLIAQPRDKVLLPVAFKGSIPGAHGSLWKVELTGHNASDQYVRVGPAFECGLGQCGGLPAWPNSTFIVETIPVNPLNGHAGYFLYIDSSGSDHVWLNLRIRDVSRQLETWGTEIPVIREEDTFERAVTLVDVPRTIDFRTTFRAYEFHLPESEVIIRVADSGGVLAEERVRLTSHGANPSAVPPQTIINDFSGRFGTGTPLRVEIIPVTPGSAIWAFISVTHDQTQHLTTVTPQ